MNNRMPRESRISLLHTKRVADWTKTLAILTIIVAGAASAQVAEATLQGHNRNDQVRQQLLLASEQLEEMRAANRPIVGIKSIEAASPVRFDDDGVTIQFRVTMENVGRTTAEFVDVEGHLIPPDRSGEPFSDASCVSRRHQKVDVNLGGKAIWPASSLDLWQNMSMSKTDYLRWLARWKSGADDEPIWMSGCVDYAYAGEHHQTTFVREIDRTSPDKWDRIDPRKGTLPQRDIVLLQHPAIAEVSD